MAQSTFLRSHQEKMEIRTRLAWRAWAASALALLILGGCASVPSRQAERPIVFYPPPPERPRLQYLHTISAEADLGRRRSKWDRFLLGEAPTGELIGRPYDVASVPGKIYVLDRNPRKLRIIDLAKRRIDSLADSGMGALQNPSGIWVTPEDIKYIADMGRKQVVVFDDRNRYLRTYGNAEVFERPVDVAVYENRVYVCDLKRNQVVVLDRASGRVLQRIGRTGADPGAFRMPSHLTVDPRGHLFVTDSFNFRVQQFDGEGRFVKAYGFPGDNLGAFARPKGLAVDHSGHLYVADAAFENVQIFDADSGGMLLYFGGGGTGAGNLYLPAGVHIDYANAQYFANFVDPGFRLEYVVYVASGFGPNRINVYGFGEYVGSPENRP